LDCRFEGGKFICTDDIYRFLQPSGAGAAPPPDLFEMWLEECLLPQLQPGDVIIIDNASFHRSQLIDEIVAEAGCEIWYLPAYSPDLNKIEHWWFVLKNWMRQRWNEFESFRDCVDAAFQQRPNVNA